MVLVEAFTITELGIFIGTVMASIGGVIMSIKQSRCKTIECCCVNCEREVIQEPTTNLNDGIMIEGVV